MTADPFDSLFAAVAQRLRAARKARGLTQSEVAERAGLAVETLSRLEKQRERPSLSTLAHLARALECPLEALVAAEGPVPDYPAPPSRRSRDLRRLSEILPRLDDRALRHLLGLARLLDRDGSD